MNFSKGYDRVVQVDGQVAWRTKEGHMIPIVHMEDAHLVNTIRMLRRWHANRVELLSRMTKVYDDEMIEELRQAGPAEAIPTYDHLVAEACRRGLRTDLEESEEEDDGISRGSSEDRRGDEASQRRYLERHARSLWLPVHHQDG